MSSLGCLSTEVTLRNYQLNAAAHWLKHRKQRGLLLQYETGTGKGLTAVNICEVALSHMNVKRVVVVAPKSLVGNFEKAVALCRVRNPRVYHIVSYENLPKRNPKLDKHTLMVIDEAHNLRNHGTAKAQSLIASATRCGRVLLLTATPMPNRPSDISPLLRLLVPAKDRAWFPYNNKEFLTLYGGNLNLYVQRVRNLILVYDEPTGKPNVSVKTHTVPLSTAQVKAMDSVVKAKLTPELLHAIKNMIEEGDSPEAKVHPAMNAFFTRMRMLSNVYDPNVCSPKIEAMADAIIKGPKPVYVYSQYKRYGIDHLRSCLLKSGKIPVHRIGFLDGSLSQAERNSLVERYNSGVLDVLLFTKAGSEGLSLLRSRQAHVMEMGWNVATEMQSIARGVRLDSHPANLPAAERTVIVHRWLSVLPSKPASLLNSIPPIHKFMIEVDSLMNQIAVDKLQTIQVFYEIHKSF